jgi:hypothetical protein
VIVGSHIYLALLWPLTLTSSSRNVFTVSLIVQQKRWPNVSFLTPVLLYVCETLREEHWLRVFEQRVLRTVFGPKRDEVTGGWRKLHNEELHNLYSSQSSSSDDWYCYQVVIHSLLTTLTHWQYSAISLTQFTVHCCGLLPPRTSILAISCQKLICNCWELLREPNWTELNCPRTPTELNCLHPR